MTTPAASQDKREIVEILRTLNHRISKQMEGYDEVEKRLDEIEKRIELYSRIAHAREKNSRQLAFTAQIHPVPLPDGNYLPTGQFPATRGDFYRLTDQAIGNLIVEFELVDSDGIPETIQAKQRILADHWGMPW